MCNGFMLFCALNSVKGMFIKMNGLTVIVPVYNVEQYLERCLNSIINQTCKPQKIIIIDDGSSDNSSIIADTFASKYENIIVIHKENGGLSSARNAGLKITETEYVTFVDSDDYLSLNMYEKLFAQMEENNADISIGGVWYEYENGEKHTPYKPGVKKVYTKIEALKELNSYRVFNMSFCDKIFKTELFRMRAYGENEIFFPDGKVSEDFYTMFKIIARAEKITYTSEAFYHYTQRPNSISRGKKPNVEPLNAAYAQLEFYRKWFPEICYIAESAYVFHHIGVYKAYERRGLKCPEDIKNAARKISRKYMKSILKNDVISLKKKMQAFIFCYAFFIYKYLIRIA